MGWYNHCRSPTAEGKVRGFQMYDRLSAVSEMAC